MFIVVDADAIELKAKARVRNEDVVQIVGYYAVDVECVTCIQSELVRY